ncbi:hypothetical protein Zmor_028358 [Zophobas morio]|uniref:PHD-type domain-containing protein n=1 Tax=Zophobas morio TaxID=2755281 RepID=A0AA38M2Y7_9CUCU|nr:hypothetical protein Zmor_028358 [Zophobas morio]
MAIKCSKCARTIGRTDNYISCKLCKHNYHISCGGLTPEAYDSLNDLGDLTIWSCNFCKLKAISHSSVNNAMGGSNDVFISVDQLKLLVREIVNSELRPLTSKIDSMDSVIRDLVTQNSFLRDEISKLTKISQQQSQISPNNITPSDINVKATYAATIAKNSQQTIIVKPKDKTQSVHKTKSDIMAKIDPVDSSVLIGKVKNLKEGGVLLGCDDVGRFKQLAKSKKLSSDYDIRDIKTLRPRIRIAGMSDWIDESCIIPYLVKQNEYIFNNVDEYKLIKFSPLKKKDKTDSFFALLEVDIETYKKALNIGHCLIGLDACSIYCGIDVLRCYKCNGYNHSSKNCNSELSCPRCAGKHVVKECTAVNLCCTNCSNLKSNEKFDNIAVDHAAGERQNCQAYQLTINKLKFDVFGISI